MLEHGHLGSVPGDEQPQLRLLLPGQGKAPNQGGDILDRVEPGGDARNNAVLRPVQTQLLQIRAPAHGGGTGGEIQTVVNGKELVRVKFAGDEQVRHGIGHANAVVQHTQGQGVDGAVGDAGEGTAQVVQAVVGVDGGDHGQAGGAPQQSAHHIAPGPMAVENFKALGAD